VRSRRASDAPPTARSKFKSQTRAGGPANQNPAGPCDLAGWRGSPMRKFEEGRERAKRNGKKVELDADTPPPFLTAMIRWTVPCVKTRTT
jgi:hypothetical protein